MRDDTPEKTPAGPDDPLIRILQRHLENYMALGELEYPLRKRLIEAFLNGAEIEPGPLTIRTPVFDDGPLVVFADSPDRQRKERNQRILECYYSIRDAIERGDFSHSNVTAKRAQQIRAESLIQLERASNRLIVNAWAVWQERRTAAWSTQDWSKTRTLVAEWLAIHETTWLLWAAGHALRFGFNSLARTSAQTALNETALLLMSS